MMNNDEKEEKNVLSINKLLVNRYIIVSNFFYYVYCNSKRLKINDIENVYIFAIFHYQGH